MSRRIAIFLIVLMVCLFAYLSSTYHIVVYNHSGGVIKKMVLESSSTNRDLVDIKDGEKMHFTIFAPFNKQVKIRIQDARHVGSIQFKVAHPFSSEKNNQVLIDENGDLKFGALGME